MREWDISFPKDIGKRLIINVVPVVELEPARFLFVCAFVKSPQKLGVYNAVDIDKRHALPLARYVTSSERSCLKLTARPERGHTTLDLPSPKFETLSSEYKGHVSHHLFL
jgi:hypothetical protein